MLDQVATTAGEDVFGAGNRFSPSLVSVDPLRKSAWDSAVGGSGPRDQCDGNGRQRHGGARLLEGIPEAAPLVTGGTVLIRDTDAFGVLVPHPFGCLLLAGIEQDDARHFLRIAMGEDADVGAADGMADEQIGGSTPAL